MRLLMVCLKFQADGWPTASARGSSTRIVLWWSVFTALTDAVSSYPLLLLTRFWFGAGEAGAFPNATASIASWFPARERGRTFGLLSVAVQVEALSARFSSFRFRCATAGEHHFTSLLWSEWLGLSSGSFGSETHPGKSDHFYGCSCPAASNCSISCLVVGLANGLRKKRSAIALKRSNCL